MVNLQHEQNGLAALDELSRHEDEWPGSSELHGLNGKSSYRRVHTASEMVAVARQFADELAARPNRGETEAPLEELKRMAKLGFLTAPLPTENGGLGMGTEPKGHHSLLRLLAAIGGGDLVLGRLYEGHVNALILIAAYGTPIQLANAAKDAHNGLLFGVWNTGASEPLKLEGGNELYTFRGGKTFASGAAFVNRPLVTADCKDHGWQMALLRMESSRDYSGNQGGSSILAAHGNGRI